MVALYAEPTVAAASDVVVMVRGLGAGVGVGVGDEGDGSAILSSADDVQPKITMKPESMTKKAEEARLRSVSM
jgi:hypothetical protein